MYPIWLHLYQFWGSPLAHREGVDTTQKKVVLKIFQISNKYLGVQLTLF